MDYAEASHFDGYHFQHIADWKEHQRIVRHRSIARTIVNNRR